MSWLSLPGNRSLGQIQRRADAARDARDWANAAVLYEKYLDRQAGDFHIWVQLGHMQKEAGDVDASLRSYGKARELRPDDADLLLSLGHLHKVRGEFKLAYEHYVLSAEAGDGGFATAEAQELRGMHPEIIFASSPPEVGARGNISDEAIDVMSFIADFTDGLSILDISAIEHDPSGDLVGITEDPWLLMRPHPIAADVRVAELQIVVDGLADGEDNLDGRIYIDYGQGFQESRAIKLPSGGGAISVLLALPTLIQHLRWDPDIKPGTFRVSSIRMRPLHDLGEVSASLRETFSDEAKQRLALRALDRVTSVPLTPAAAADIQWRVSALFDVSQHYIFWLDSYVDPTESDYARMSEMLDEMKIRPRFSFVMPTYNTPPDLLRECLDSMLSQTYPDFEICIADDASPNEDVRNVLLEYAARDSRVRIEFRKRNGHISATSNAALNLATGDFIVLVDHDDLIPDYTLSVIAHYVNKYPDAVVFYSDEDKIDTEGNRYAPYFKTEFSKFLMFGHNMVSHLGVYRRSAVEAIGGFRLGLEGSQDYDLFLRCYEQCGDKGVVHIPHVLYHWRAIPGSTALSADQKSYAIVAAEAAINGYFERNGIALRSTTGVAPGLTSIRNTREYDTSVSIIIPTRDGLDVLQPCVQSVLDTRPGNVEILILDNGSIESKTKKYFSEISKIDNVHVLNYDKPFNFSEINNFGAKHATGDILCFLNNDTEVMRPDWIDRARMLLALEGVGMVGARLQFPDGLLQHFGIALGLGDHRIAGTPHQGMIAEHFGYFGKGAVVQDFSAVTAACMFVHAKSFFDLGGFDPEFSVAYNDIDLCLRYRQAGFRILCDPNIALIHKESRTRGSDKTGEKAARLEKEGNLMRDRWKDVLDNDPFWSPNHAYDRADFALAYPPRVPMPWREEKR